MPGGNRHSAADGLARAAALIVCRASLALALALATAVVCEAQVCRLSVAGLNRARRVMGPVNAECPDPLHSAPFGNWGVTSNFGHKLDGRQFEGWCHSNHEIVDNSGFRRRVCGSRWHQWNSCTDHPLFRAPNCTLYNSADCTEQVSTSGVNVLGTQFVDIAVSCPADTDGDGQLDTGGCSDVRTYSHGTNFMSIYELDPFTGDDLVQTLIYPETVVELTCDFWGCLPTGSQWLPPAAYDSPQSPPRIFAEMAMAVNSGTFVDAGGACETVTSLVTVSAASFQGPLLAAGSLASAFGRALSPTSQAAASTPLPETLAGVRVTVTDRNQREVAARMLFVSPGQVNFEMPVSVLSGPGTVKVYGPTGELRASGLAQLEKVAPSLFAASSDGQGVAAAIAVRVGQDGGQQVEDVFRCDSQQGRCSPVELRLGSGTEQVILVLFGTGFRWRQSLDAVRVTVGGEPAEVLYAGLQLRYPGLDQLNVRLPRSLAGRGEVEVLLEVDGKAANPVTVSVR
jgi:uncharacterized protein (TIGR03437 family)